MKAGIISAGEGVRLQADGIDTPKPLLNVGGMPLIDRLLKVFSENGVTEVACIVNDRNRSVPDHVATLDLSLSIRWIRKSTESSMHSLFELSPFLSDGPFLLATVDSIFDPVEFHRFVVHCRRSNAVDGILAVSPFVGDQTPLWVQVDRNLRIVRLGKDLQSAPYVAGGVYYFSPSIFSKREQALRAGVSRLSRYLGWLVEGGFRFDAYEFSKIVDVDRASDIESAEQLLRTLNSVGQR